MLSESPQPNYLVTNYVARATMEVGHTCILDVDKRQILQKCFANDAMNSVALTLKINNMGSSF